MPIGAAIVLLLAAGCRVDPSEEGRLLGGLTQLYAIPITSGDASTEVPGTDGLRLFIATLPDVHAHDLKSGARLWTYAGGGRPARIVTAGGKVFWGWNGYAYAVDAATGAELWRVDAGGATHATQGDADGAAFFIGNDRRRVIALDAASGAVRWGTDVGPDWQFTGWVRGLTVSDDMLYASVEHRLDLHGARTLTEVFALDKHTGAILWNYTFGDGNQSSLSTSSPRVAGELLLLNIGSVNTVVAINRLTGIEVWRSVTPGNWAGPREPPEVRDNIGYTASSAPYVEAINVRDGSRLWATPVPEGISGISYFALCGSRLLVREGGLGVLDLRNGRWLGQMFADAGVYYDPVVLGDTAYLTTRDALVAVRCPS